MTPRGADGVGPHVRVLREVVVPRETSASNGGEPKRIGLEVREGN